MLIERIWSANPYRNFHYLIACPETGEALAVDPLEWRLCLDAARQKGWAITQILNSVGALTLVYAFRYGKAIVVSPLTNAGAPLITALIALALLGLVPQPLKLVAIALAFVAAALLAIEPEERA